jgi:hypothetical protein
MVSAGVVGGIAAILLGVMAMILGAKGFTEEGLPWSRDVRIRGSLGKLLGTIDVVIGVVLVMGGILTIMLILVGLPGR